MLPPCDIFPFASCYIFSNLAIVIYENRPLVFIVCQACLAPLVFSQSLLLPNGASDIGTGVGPYVWINGQTLVVDTIDDSGTAANAVTFVSHIWPADLNRDLGSASLRWRNGWFANNAVFGGTVGIGVDAPQANLHIRKNSIADLYLEAIDAGGQPAFTTAIHLRGYGNRGKGIFITDPNSTKEFFIGKLYSADGIGIGVDDATASQSEYPAKSALFVSSGRNVGIGTTSPDHKLDVNGTIRAKEVIVESDWSDFVFEPDYRLRPLSEVESHIAERGHLPDVRSASEIAADGLSVGEAQRVMMQKIEELTLYMIEKDKQIEALRARVWELERERE